MRDEAYHHAKSGISECEKWYEWLEIITENLGYIHTKIGISAHEKRFIIMRKAVYHHDSNGNCHRRVDLYSHVGWLICM